MSLVSTTVARWWRVENGERGLPAVSVAYETDEGTWWEWWPETGQLHPAHWLGVAHEHPDALTAEGYRFVPLDADDVPPLLTADTGQYDPEHSHLVAARRQHAVAGQTLDPPALLDSSGSSEAGSSFSVYRAGLTGEPWGLPEIVADKLRTDPESRPTVVAVLRRMLERLRAGEDVRVPGAASRPEAIEKVERALEVAGETSG